MPRPIVLVATTNPIMAYALHERLKEYCRKLGLRLDICPEGAKSKVGNENVENVRTYDSSEALFDALEKRDPAELADTLVVLDLGAGLGNAFEPKASTDSWHVTQNRAGIAVELLLRFPQVFPVFMSPSVPSNNNENGLIHPKDGEAASGKKLGSENWFGYFNLQTNLATRHMEGGKATNIIPLDTLFALTTPLHFVSPLDHGHGLYSVLQRFARGMRCWFDPTGLRTLVKNRFLGTVFGNNEKWKANTQREVLLGRLNNVCVAIDEEREFALLNAYTAWKFGRRAWVVTTFGEFDDSPLWVYKEGDLSDVIVLRDIDVRFPDMPDASILGLQKEISPRELMMDIYSCLWSNKEKRDCKIISDDTPENKVGKGWRVRAVSSESGVIQNPKNWKNEEFGQCGKEYLGLKKPIGTIYDLKKPWLLGKYKNEKPPHDDNVVERPELRSAIGNLGVVQSEGNTGGHGAPYTNLAMAESLLISSGRCKDHSSSHLIGALLAMEAYELLLGMSKTTALEALLSLHRHEAAAEVKFPGVSNSLKIKDRIEDVGQTLIKLYEDNKTDAGEKEQVKRMFLSQFWAELRIQYKDGEQFDAAEEANIQSLLNMSWKPKQPEWLAKTVNKFSIDLIGLKKVIVRTATSPFYWLQSTLVSSFVLTIFYGCYGWLSNQIYFDIGWKEFLNFLEIWWQVIMSMLQVQLGNEGVVAAAKMGDGFGLYVVEFFHMGVSYVLLGLLISMLYRKITRT